MFLKNNQADIGLVQNMIPLLGVVLNPAVQP